MGDYKPRQEREMWRVMSQRVGPEQPESDGYRTVYHSATGGEPAVVQEGAEQQEAPENPYRLCPACSGDADQPFCVYNECIGCHGLRDAWQAGFDAGRRAR